jgi:hypothetical protein
MFPLGGRLTLHDSGAVGFELEGAPRVDVKRDRSAATPQLVVISIQRKAQRGRKPLGI